MQPSSRPVFLNLWRIRLPVAAVMSIAHRVAGVVLFLAIPLCIALVSLALSGEDGFTRAISLLHSPAGKLGLFLLLWALSHHFLAGIRYLLLDAHLGVRAPYFRHSARAVLVAAPIVALFLLWGLM